MVFFGLLGTLTASSLRSQAAVVETLHNLSSSGPGDIRAINETQVCKFCHIPHNAVVPVPLWGHTLSRAQYNVPEVSTGEDGKRVPAPQPDGSSRLCLSCHDGTVALGDITSEGKPIAMLKDSTLRPGRPGFLGTDLSGSHPISMVIQDSAPESESDVSDMTMRPLSSISASTVVKLDGQGKMQCTTCHDPHSDEHFQEGKIPHFWVGPSVDEVCLTCHLPR